MILGSKKGPGAEKIAILKSFQHKWSKYGPHIGPKMAQHRRLTWG